MTQGRPEAIVVGVDGSPSSVDALRWAMRQAHVTGAELRVVSAWSMPVGFAYPAYGAALDDVDWEAEARRTVDRALGEVADAEHPAKVTTRVVNDHPGTVLVAESRDADLLVVGSRGHGTAVGMLLGSVSQHCVHHSECPVVVFRPSRD